MIGIHYGLHDRTQLYQSLVIVKEHWVEKFFCLSLGLNQVLPNVLSNELTLLKMLTFRGCEPNTTTWKLGLN